MNSRLETLWDTQKNLQENLKSLFATDLNPAPQEYTQSGFRDERYGAYQEYKKMMKDVLQSLEAKNIKDLELTLKGIKTVLTSPLYKPFPDLALKEECLQKIDFSLKKIEQAQEEKNFGVAGEMVTLQKKIESLWSKDKNLLENICYLFEQDLTFIPSTHDQIGFFNNIPHKVQQYKNVKTWILMHAGSEEARREFYHLDYYEKLMGKEMKATPKPTLSEFYEMLVIELHRLNNRVDNGYYRNELAAKINFAISKVELEDKSLSAKRAMLIQAYEDKEERRQNLAF